MSFAKYAAEIWRAYVVDGNASSGAQKPVKSDIRAWGASVEEMLGRNWSATTWLTATAYAVGDTLEYGGVAYRCTTAHTSGASTEPGVGASWASYWQTLTKFYDPSGTAAAPGGAFGVEQGTGVYRPAANQWAVSINGTGKALLTANAWCPVTNDALTLGNGALMWADLFLASGAVINFNAGDVTITHSSNALVFAGASSGYTFTEGITGVTTNSDAASGIIGEYVSSEVLRASAVGLTSNSGGNVTSISLTAGDWDLEGNVAFTANGTAAFTQYAAWISTSSASFPTRPNTGGVQDFRVASVTPANTADITIATGRMRISVSGTTTVYLSCMANFTSTCSGYGFISARRVR